MEEKLIDGDQLTVEDKDRVNDILDRIVKDGRIRISSDDNATYIKQKTAPDFYAQSVP